MALIDGGSEILSFQRAGELSGIWRLDFADSTAENKSFSFGNCITSENEIFWNTSWEVKTGNKAVKERIVRTAIQRKKPPNIYSTVV